MTPETNYAALVGTVARAILQSVGGVLVTKGVIESSQLEPAIGAILMLGGLVWSYFRHKNAPKNP